MAVTDRDILAGFQKHEAASAPPPKWRVELDLDTREKQAGLPSGLLTAVLQAESNGNPAAQSSAGAKGLFQLMDATAKAYNADPYNPRQAADAATQELRTLYQKYDGDIPSTLAAWNWGQGNLDRNGLKQAPGETRQFIAKVTKTLDRQLVQDFRPTPGKGLLARAGELVSPASAEAATPSDRDILTGFTPSAAPQAPASSAASVQPSPPPATVKLTPDMNDEQIMSALGYDPAVIKTSSYYQPNMLKKRVTNPNSTYAKVMNSVFGLPGGIYQGGVVEPIQAGAQLVARGLRAIGSGNDGDVALYDLLADLSVADYGQNIRGGKTVDSQTGRLKFEASRLAGAVLVPSGTSMGTSKLAQRLAPSLVTSPVAQTMVRGAVQGAVGALEAPVEGARGQGILGAKAEQAGLGAAAGAVLAPAAGYAANKLSNVGRGVQPPGYQEVQQAGAQHGVRLSAGDIAADDAPNVGRLETLMEQVPGVGLAGVRRGQQGEAQAAAATVREGLAEHVARTRYTSVPDIERVAQTAGPRQQQAQILLQEIEQAGDDWRQILKVSGNVSLFGKQLRSDALYARVDQIAAGIEQPLVPTQTREVLAETLREAKDAILVDSRTATLLQQIKQRLPATPTYAQAAALRSDLGDLVRHPGEVIGHKGERALKQVKQALETDMYQFTQESGNDALAKASQQANTFYREQVIPYRDTALARSLSTAQPDTVYKTFIRQSTTPDQAKFFYQALDPKGQAAVRLGMVEEAIEVATQPTTQRFSPAKYAQYLERIQDSVGVFFRGAEKQELDGFTQLMRHIPRASAYAENPPTGSRQTLAFILGGAAGASGAFAPATMVHTALATLTLRALTTTPAGKAILLAASRLPDDAPGWQQLLAKAAPLIAARAGGRSIAEGESITVDPTRR